jgi:pimeloyl-ACP methyl ester carboxylesterase
VAVLRSPNPTGPPLLLLNGGPAGESGELVPLMVNRGLTLRRLLQGRDVVVFDQRGVGGPCRPCRAPVETLVARHDTPAEALRACASRLGRWGVDVAAYASAESAADVAALAAALGAPRVDLYGSSYGSRLALHRHARPPAVVRSAILDAPVPLEVDLAADFG